MTGESFNILLIVMTAIAAIVFVTLYFVEAGYGMLFDKKWGFPIPNKVARWHGCAWKHPSSS